jgi:hypothetical protein
MAWSVTIKAGLKDVVMPDMKRYQAGAIVVMSDTQIAQLSPRAFANLFTAAPVLATATWPAGGV